jgi:hypothetical protein
MLDRINGVIINNGNYYLSQNKNKILGYFIKVIIILTLIISIIRISIIKFIKYLINH